MSERIGRMGGVVLAVTAATLTLAAPAHAGRIQALATGDAVTCAAARLGPLWCWGQNDAGQLGDGSTNERHRPRNVGTTYVVATRDRTTCRSDIQTSCTGANNFGQIGDGTTVERHTFTLAQTASAVGIFTITAGNSSCESRAHNSPGGGPLLSFLSCWGGNQFGQVGDGTTADRSLPIDIGANFDRVPALATSGGNGHTCAVVTTVASPGQGTALWCWGNNAGNALGVGGAVGPYSSVPVEVTALGTNVASAGNYIVGAGIDYTCARKADGTLWCWGRNDFGQLGDGTTTASDAPVQVAALGTSVLGVTVSPSGSFTCASTSTGPFCWGRNDHGQLGDGTTTERHLPTPVAFLGAIAEISAGRDHACLLVSRNTDEVWCWGFNDHGQVGDGTTIERHAPVAIPLVSTPAPPVPASRAPLAVALSLALAVVGLLRTRGSVKS